MSKYNNSLIDTNYEYFTKTCTYMVTDVLKLLLVEHHVVGR